MLVVYQGPARSINVDSLSYDRGVPTYVLPGSEAKLSHHDDFEIYDPKIDRDKYSPLEAKNIVIYPPGKLVHFLASIQTIRRISQNYPNCKIDVVTHSNFDLFIAGIDNVDIINSIQPGNYFYYRTFKLDPSYNSHIWSGINIRNFSYEFLILLSSRMNIEGDLKKNIINRLKIKKIKVDKPYVVIITKGSNPGNTYQGLAEYLDKNMTGFEKKIINKLKIDNLSEKVDLINNASYVISCGESEFSYLAAYLGVKLFVFLPRQTDIRIEKQYDFFDQVQFTFIDGPDKYESICNSMIEKIKGLIKGESKKNIEPEPDLVDKAKIKSEKNGEKKSKKGNNK